MQATETTSQRERIEPAGDLGIASALRRLRDDASTLFRQEVELAKAEFSEKSNRVGRNLAYLAVGIFVAQMAVAFVLLSLCYGLFLAFDSGMDSNVAAWLAPLVLGLAIGVVAYFLIRRGIDAIRQESALPERTVESIREQSRWMKERLT